MEPESNLNPVATTNVDRQHVLGRLRDFRLLAAALGGDVPDWIDSLERLVDPTGAPARVAAAAPTVAIPVTPVPPPLAPAAPREAPTVAMPVAPAPSAPAVAAPAPPASSTTEAPESDNDETVNLGELAPTAAPATFITSPSPEAPPTPPDHDANLADRYFRKGESYCRQRDYKRAVACYTEALRLQPQLVAALLERGQIYRLARKPELAIPDFNAALALDPSHVEGFLRRGNALVDQGRFDEAIEDYSVALGLAPENATAYLNRALAHARKQDNAGVLRDAEAALQLDPSLAAAYLLRGTAYSNRKSHDLALADLNRAVQLDPHNALAFHERGLAFARKGNYPHAVLSYSKALALAPKLHIARFNRALAHRLQGNHDIAVAEFTTFLQVQPRVAEAYYQRGLAARACGDLPAALNDFDQTLMLKSDHGDAAAARLETQQESFDRGQSVPANAATAPQAATPVAGSARVVPRPTPSGPRAPYRPAPRTHANNTRPENDDGPRRRLLAGISVAAAALLLIGFVASTLNRAEGEFQAPRTVAVQGTVLYKGKPLDGVRVMLHPQFDMGAINFRPSGVSDAQGRFTLTTGAPNDGAPPGEYVVTFSRPRADAEDEVDTWRGRHSDPARSKWRVVVKADSGLEPLQID
jgi:tetratricopeptide (TPR) repeat protein